MHPRQKTNALKKLLAGATFDLIDEVTVESFRFHARDNGVAATLGRRDGAVCGPLLECKVTDEGTVQLFSCGELFFTWEQIEVVDGVATVRCGQQVKRFAYTPGKIQQSYLP